MESCQALRPQLLVGNSLIGSVLGVRGNLFGLSFDVFVGRPLRKPAELEAAMYMDST